MKIKIQSFILFMLFSVNSIAEMAKISDQKLAEVTGQSGVYLTGEVSINEEGGVFDDADHNNNYFGLCSNDQKVCGARLAFKTQETGGWFVIDDIKGSVAFEGLTFQVREITSGFGGDGESFNKAVMEIGMPESIRMNDFEFTLATGNSSRPSDSGYRQVDFMTVEMSGELTLEGNLLVFPTP